MTLLEHCESGWWNLCSMCREREREKEQWRWNNHVESIVSLHDYIDANLMYHQAPFFSRTSPPNRVMSAINRHHQPVDGSMSNQLEEIVCEQLTPQTQMMIKERFLVCHIRYERQQQQWTLVHYWAIVTDFHTAPLSQACMQSKLASKWPVSFSWFNNLSTQSSKQWSHYTWIVHWPKWTFKFIIWW